jgi:hypothetical protein
VCAIHFSVCAFFISEIWFSFTAPASALLWLFIRPSIPCVPVDLFLFTAFHSHSPLRGRDFLLCPASVVLQLAYRASVRWLFSVRSVFFSFLSFPLGCSRRTPVSSSICLSASCCGSHARFLRVKSFIAISHARSVNLDSRFQLCRPLHSLLVHSAPAHTIFLPSVVCFGLSTSQDQVFLCCLSARRL